MALTDNESKASTEWSGAAEPDAPSLPNGTDFHTNTQDNGRSDSEPGDLSAGAVPANSDPQPAPKLSTTPAGSGSAPAPSSSTQQAKKYTVSNINKKFLEKNSTTAASTPSHSVAANMKSSSTIARPQPTTTSSHSRLVTTKLTATSQAGAPGWSRPSSATPPIQAASPNGIRPNGQAAGDAMSQAVKGSGNNQKEKGALGASKSNRPVWGNVKPGQASVRTDVRVQNDFPTAAEVAQGAIARSRAQELEAIAQAEKKQAMMQQADAFRGVHLDPNAHHWDEMEEDDDNFLDGVIEFGDGRQYKIESTENPTSQSRPVSPARSQISSHSKPDDGQNISSEPVSKEERFADDFDRSWPRSHQTNASITSKESDSSVPSTPAMISPTESKVLFNERSNRLEPYNNAKSQRRGSQMEQPPNDQRMQNGGRSDRAPGRRDTATSVPMTPRGLTGPPTPKDRDFGGADSRGRRLSNMGPPPIPPQKMPPPSVAKDARPLPPHMDPTILPAEIPGRKPSPTPSNRSDRHSSTAGVSPILASAPLAAVDLDEVTKDTMQSAAARAKARRQQEEEERAKAQERAKKKAQEIQEKMEKERLEKEVAKRTEVESAVTAILEEAIKDVDSKGEPSAIELGKIPLRRAPSTRGSLQQLDTTVRPRRQSVASANVQSAAPPSSASESWRRPTAPPASTSSAPRSAQPSAWVSPTSAIEQSLADVRETDLEVVEFTDMAKFVGVSDEPVAEEATEVSRVLGSRPPRPTAADFLDSQPDSSKSEAPASWRSSRAAPPTEAQKEVEVAPVVESSPPPTVAPAPKSPYKQTFRKEAPMTTLDDVMSRIKGALDVMQNAEKEAVVAEAEASTPRPIVPPKERWIPPALRERHVPDPENFSITTVSFLLESADSKVRLPKISPPPLPIHHRQLVMFHKWHPPRPDTLSYDPIAQGMHKKEATLSEMLHRKPLFKGSKFRYKVLLPRVSYRIPTGPRVNLPPRTPGAFGKPTPAEEASTWRKSRSSDGVDPSSGTLDVSAETETKADGKDSTVSTSQRRVQPKMPAGSSVAFYRDSKIVEVESDAMPLVSFIVTSELDENKQTSEDLVSRSPLSSKISQQSSPVAPNGVTSKTSPLPLVNGIMPPGMSTSEFSLPALSPSKSEGRSTTDTSEITPLTPQSHHASTWTRSSLSMPVKESPPSRAPDPEHLKALWSQTPSNKSGASMQPVNSLKNINDDMPVIPFTLQEVKSEDGGTPPPASSQSNTARTSFDVRSAFQQVPTSSLSTSLRPTISPPSTNAPVARPAPNATTSSFTPTSSTPSSHPNQTVPRPPYPAYPMGHSPSPVMYASHPMPGGPMQSRMPVNGPPTPMYGAPMWVPVPAGHQGGPAGIMRPVPSPYPTPMMPYPPGQPQYFAAHMPPPPQNMPPNSQNGPQNQPGVRGRGPSVSSGSAAPPVMMSPVMQHAHPVPMHPGMTMYANSPMPMHMSPMQAHAQPVPQQHSHFQPPSNGQQGSQPHIPFQPMQPGFPPRPAW